MKKNALGIEKVMHSVCFWNIRPLLFVFVTIKKTPSVFARNEDFFRCCTWNTPVFNFKGNNSVFSTSLFVIHEKSSQHSRRGTSDKYMKRHRFNTLLSYMYFFFYPIRLFNVILFLRIRFIVLWHSLHFLKIGFLIFILKIFRVFFFLEWWLYAVY